MRVIGQMRAFNQVRSIVAFHIQPLTDFNEYTFHFIEVVHTHLRNTKGAAVSDPLPPHPTRSTPHVRHTPRCHTPARHTPPRLQPACSTAATPSPTRRDRRSKAHRRRARAWPARRWALRAA